MSFLPSMQQMTRVKPEPGAGLACPPASLSDLKALPMLTVFNFYVNHESTHQPFLLDSSLTFTCKADKKKNKTYSWLSEHIVIKNKEEKQSLLCSWIFSPSPSTSRSWASCSFCRRSLKLSIISSVHSWTSLKLCDKKAGVYLFLFFLIIVHQKNLRKQDFLFCDNKIGSSLSHALYPMLLRNNKTCENTHKNS